MKQATKLIHAGEGVDTGQTPSLTTPIYETSTFVFDSVADVEKYQQGKLNGYLYSRYENPTVVAVEQKLAAVDGAEASLLFSSGMAAIATALMTLLKAGDEIICCSAIYGGTFHIIEDLLLASHLDSGKLQLAIVECDVRRLTGEVVAAAETHLPENVVVALAVDDDVPAVHADPNQLRQVIADAEIDDFERGLGTG